MTAAAAPARIWSGTGFPTIADHDFAAGPVDEAVAATALFDVAPDARANALRTSGAITLREGVTPGATMR